MAKKTAAIADLPFYDYLWQFYRQNRSKIRKGYLPLTRKLLDFNDPDKGGESFLRRPQFEALEVYVFLKEGCGNARVAEVFRDWHERRGVFAGRGAFSKKGGELALFEHVDAKAFEAAFSRMKASAASYPNYVYALTMGVGKTILMATCVFYEFLLAQKYPKDARFCHNALVFAPDKTVLQSLKEIQTFDKSKVVPPEYAAKLDACLKFHFLDDASTSLQVLEGSDYNIIISNTQKIILRREHKEKGAAERLFACEIGYVPAAEAKKPKHDVFAGLDDAGLDAIETEEDLKANQRFEMLRRLKNLGIYVDEAHHAFGRTLERDFTAKTETSLRATINRLAADLERLGSRVVACFNYTGTPYVENVILPEVVYAYALKDAIDNRYLKQAEVKGYANAKSREFVRIAVRDFWEKCGTRRVEGMLPKMAIFASDIAELTKELRPAVEAALTELGVPLDRILVNVGDDKVTTNDDLREFVRLDTAASEKQFVLLVNKGKEGWNCRSLFAVALHRTPKSRVFVLQATMRCLRAIGPVQETGLVYLSEENRAILDEELRSNFRLDIDEFTGAGEKRKVRVKVHAVPPPVTVKIKIVRKRFKLKELNLKDAIDFGLDAVDPLRYAVTETTTDLRSVGRDGGVKKVVEGVKENVEYSPLTLTAEVARYLGKGCVDVARTLERSKEGMAGVVASVNKYNEILYDVVIPKLFHAFYDLEESVETEERELRLVRPPKGKGDPTKPPTGGGGGKGAKGGGDDEAFVSDFSVLPELLATRGDKTFGAAGEKTFHLDNYCFDSHPEMDFFRAALKDEDIAHLYFTGMLTSDKTEFKISYIDPESNTLRTYYPDFLAQKTDGSYVIVEIKGENKIDDAVVLAKKSAAEQMASVNAMTYAMIPGGRAAYGLRQPARMTELLHRLWAEGEFPWEERFAKYLPVYGFAAACGKFGAGEEVACTGWMDVTDAGLGRLGRNENLFVVQAKGHSMEPTIRDGQFCVFEHRKGAFHDNDIVLAQHAPNIDTETEGAFSIKKIEKRGDQIVLRPVNAAYDPITLPASSLGGDYKIVGTLCGVVNEV